MKYNVFVCVYYLLLDTFFFFLHHLSLCSNTQHRFWLFRFFFLFMCLRLCVRVFALCGGFFVHTYFVLLLLFSLLKHFRIHLWNFVLYNRRTLQINLFASNVIVMKKMKNLHWSLNGETTHEKKKYMREMLFTYWAF